LTLIPLHKINRWNGLKSLLYEGEILAVKDRLIKMLSVAHTLAMFEVGGNGNLLLVPRCVCLYFGEGESKGCFYEVAGAILWRTETENTLTFVILCSFPEGAIR